MKKILYVILNGKVNISRINALLFTWGKSVDTLIYSDFDEIERNIIKVSENTTYWSNEEKHVNVIKTLGKRNLEHDWYFFCDDDTFVNVEKMNEFLTTCKTDTVYGHLLNYYVELPNLYYHSGGAGVLMSREILEFVSKKIELRNTKYSDVTLGITLRENGIKMEDSKMFNSGGFREYQYTPESIKNFITFHRAYPEDMILLYEALK